FLSKIINPTLHFTPGNARIVPIPTSNKLTKINLSVTESISVAQSDWNSRETSWDFEHNEFIKLQRETIQTALEKYKNYWTQQFYQLHCNEEELNRQFIEIYELQDELTPEVPLDEITILQEELDRKK